jgi:hypothetical protein
MGKVMGRKSLGYWYNPRLGVADVIILQQGYGAYHKSTDEFYWYEGESTESGPKDIRVIPYELCGWTDDA